MLSDGFLGSQPRGRAALRLPCRGETASGGDEPVDEETDLAPLHPSCSGSFGVFPGSAAGAGPEHGPDSRRPRPGEAGQHLGTVGGHGGSGTGRWQGFRVQCRGSLGARRAVLGAWGTLVQAAAVPQISGVHGVGVRGGDAWGGGKSGSHIMTVV